MQEVPAQSTHTPWQNLTPSQLTAVWWQWAFSIPESSSPLFDDTGARAHNGQPYSDLLFLCGTFSITNLQNGDVIGEVTRSISVKQGTALFFPLINSELDNVCGTPHLGGNCFNVPQFPQVLGVQQMQAKVAAQLDSVIVTSLHSMLTPTDAKFNKATGPTQNLNMPRLQSPPFSYTLPATDNLYQINVSGTVSPAVADGYYSFIPGTLLPGYYVLRFGGSAVINEMGNTFTEAITYQITVTN